MHEMYCNDNCGFVAYLFLVKVLCVIVVLVHKEELFRQRQVRETFIALAANAEDQPAKIGIFR